MTETMKYTQANRQMRVATPLEEDELLLAGFTGEETISRLFRYQLDLLSTSGDIEGKALLGQPMTVTLVTAGGGERQFNGIVSRFACVGRDADLFLYRAEVVPSLWLLTRRLDSRIFQDLTVLEIVERVLKERGISEFRIDCVDQYAKREFCVQYRETDFDFVNRLLENEGIYYYFEHASDEHTLVLADTNSSAPPVAGENEVEYTSQPHIDHDVITAWEKSLELRPGKYTLWDYCFETPDSHLEATIDGENELEYYDYPGGHQKREDGEFYARIRLEAHEVLRETVRGAGTARQLVAGHTFTLARHFNDDGEYLLTSVRHAAQLGDYRSDMDGTLDYQNEFQAIPLSVPFRPQRVTRKPVIRGTQTALVVGKQGEEIWVDKYGRIKVQFHWDREGRKDENSSCWVRVAMPWAGKGWGAVSLPRIGNEVVVSFLEGDPDRPLVVGSVYNASQAPPFELPGTGIQMGMKSRSSPGGGGYNEITLTDTKGKEQITIHGQHDMNTTVENDQNITVNSGNRTMAIKSGTLSDTVKGDATLTIQAGSRTVSVTGGDYSAVASDGVVLHGQSTGVSITGDAKGVGITGNGEGVAIEGNGDGVAITGNGKGVSIEGNGEGVGIVGNGQGVGITGDPDFFAEGMSSAGIKAPVVDIGDSEINIVGTKITIAAGASTIVLDPGGVTIQGPLVKIN